LIGKREECRRAFADAEASERTEGFTAAHRAPPRAIACFDEKLSLDEPLRPGIVLAVGDEDDVNVTARREDALNEATSGDDVVVRMRGQNDRALNRKRESH